MCSKVNNWPPKVVAIGISEARFQHSLLVHKSFSCYSAFRWSDMPESNQGSFVGEYARDVYQQGERVHTFLNNRCGNFERDDLQLTFCKLYDQCDDGLLVVCIFCHVSYINLIG